jgi:hypothetical protein
VRVCTPAELPAIAAELIAAIPAAAGVRRGARAAVPKMWSALERRHIDRKRRIVRVERENDAARIVPDARTSVREAPLTRAALDAPPSGQHFAVQDANSRHAAAVTLNRKVKGSSPSRPTRRSIPDAARPVPAARLRCSAVCAHERSLDPLER